MERIVFSNLLTPNQLQRLLRIKYDAVIMNKLKEAWTEADKVYFNFYHRDTGV
jgi:hypothetical protein